MWPNTYHSTFYNYNIRCGILAGASLHRRIAECSVIHVWIILNTTTLNGLYHIDWTLWVKKKILNVIICMATGIHTPIGTTTINTRSKAICGEIRYVYFYMYLAQMHELWRVKHKNYQGILTFLRVITC